LQFFCENVGKIDGYTNMQGEETARESILKKFNSKAYNLSRDDLYLTAGGTMAVWATMQLLAGKDKNGGLCILG
jgi:aspartate/methionine/tyrosine aminotransferase